MLSKLLFITVLVIVGTNASLFDNEDPNRFSGLKSIQSIENSKFGRQLLDTIALQLKNGSPLGDIAGLLADIRADLVSQQNADDKLQEERRVDCTTSIDNFERRIQTADDNVAQAIGDIGSLRTQITDLKSMIKNYAAQMVIVSDHLETVRSDRAKDAAEYVERKARTEQTVEALQMILPKLKALSHIAPPAALMELAKIGKTNPIASLMQVAASLDTDRLDKVLEKMDELLQSMQASLVEDAANEVASQAAFEGLVRDLEATHVMLTTAHTTAVSNKEQAESKLKMTERFLEEQRAEGVAARNGLEAKVEQCNLWEANYASTKESRTAERNVVEMVQKILAERLQSMSEYLTDRVDV